MAGIELVQDRVTRQPFPPEARVGGQVCRAAREQGVLLRPLGDVIVVMPPLSMDIASLDQLLEVLSRCLE